MRWVNSCRLFSWSKPGPDGTTCARIPDCSSGMSRSSANSPSSASSVSEYQSEAKTASSSSTTGPVQRTMRSFHTYPRRRFERLLYVGWMMFCEPVKATCPSTTRILRWFRRSIRWYSPRHGLMGRLRRHVRPDESSSRTSSRYPG